jgi:hypothetical protein
VLLRVDRRTTDGAEVRNLKTDDAHGVIAPDSATVRSSYNTAVNLASRKDQ